MAIISFRYADKGKALRQVTRRPLSSRQARGPQSSNETIRAVLLFDMKVESTSRGQFNTLVLAELGIVRNTETSCQLLLLDILTSLKS
jgi:hypothetical protein